MSAETPSHMQDVKEVPGRASAQADSSFRLSLKAPLEGRFMRTNGTEFLCVLNRISVNTADISFSTDNDAPAQMITGETIIAYFADIGRIEGIILDSNRNGFAIHMQMTSRQKEKLSEKLQWMNEQDTQSLPDHRRHARYTPEKTEALLTLDDGTQHTCKILDLSLSGAAIVTELRPAIHSILSLGQTQAKVMRHFDTGIAVEFITLQA
jgi:hypothetical protein